MAFLTVFCRFLTSLLGAMPQAFLVNKHRFVSNRYYCLLVFVFFRLFTLNIKSAGNWVNYFIKIEKGIEMFIKLIINGLLII
jgi:hypothetical protein